MTHNMETFLKSLLGVIYLVTFLFGAFVDGLPTGAPNSACTNLLPGHVDTQGVAIEPQPSSQSPFVLFIGSQTTYDTRTPISVSILRTQSAPVDAYFRGFAMKAVTVVSGTDSSTKPAIGVFTTIPLRFRYGNCSTQNQLVTHSNTDQKSARYDFTWIAVQPYGNIQFTSTLAEERETFYTNVHTNVLTFDGNVFTASSTMTTHTEAIIGPVTSFETRDPTKQEGVLPTIITITILVTLIVIAVLVFIVWRRHKKSAINKRAQHQANDDNNTSLNVICGTADGRGSGDGRGPGDAKAATAVYQALNEPARVSSGIQTGLNADGYYEDTEVENVYYEISADRTPEEQGSRKQLGQDEDERKASPCIHLYGNQNVISQREQRSGRASILTRKAEPEYFEPI